MMEAAERPEAHVIPSIAQAYEHVQNFTIAIKPSARQNLHPRQNLVLKTRMNIGNFELSIVPGYVRR